MHILPGDIIEAECTYGKLYTPYTITETGVVTSVKKRYEWDSSHIHDKLIGRRLDNSKYMGTESAMVIKLLRIGTGEVIPGITFELTPAELREQRLQAWRDKCAAHDQTHEGWTNGATFLANLYLENEPGAYQYILSKKRKDGTINPSKIKQAFAMYKLSVDDWAFDCPVDTPEEFKGAWYPNRPKINWQEIADHWSTKE